MAYLSYEDVGITEPEEGTIEFEITKEHLKLLRQAQLEWVPSAWGGWQQNMRRPYGSEEFRTDVSGVYDTELLLSEEECLKLHRGAAMALQIALKTGKFKAGTFRAPKYSQLWHEHKPKKVKVKDEPEDEEQAPLDLSSSEA